MQKGRLFTLSLFAIIVALVAGTAQAGCPNPNESGGESPEGAQVYNLDHKVMQFCDGTNWYSMKGSCL